MEKNIKNVSSISEIQDLAVDTNIIKKEKAFLKKQVLIFELAGKYFGIDIMDVKEILDTFRIRKLPNSNIYIEGLLNLRGEIIPIINLQKRLEIENITIEDLTKSVSEKLVDENKNNADTSVINSEKEDSKIKNRKNLINENNQYGNIIVCNMKEGLGGIIVEKIVKVTYLDENQYEEAPKLLRFVGDKFIKGFVKIDNQVIVTLDIDALFFS
ncbi:MAG: chemotaxis protein CheW [Spirochaetes bacterium]|nr:chemotaxis protein CheW [Spirochaetota bacterium]